MFRYTCRLNIGKSGSNWRTRMKRNGEEISPYPSPSSPYPSSPGSFFLFTSLCSYPESRGPSIPYPLSSIHFVLRARESRDCCRKTTGSKNDLHGVEPPYLVPLLPLSSNIIRVIVRNVPVWESYISHIYHMIDCVQHSISVLIHDLWNPSENNLKKSMSRFLVRPLALKHSLK